MDERSAYGEGFDYAVKGNPVLDYILRTLPPDDKTEWLEGFRDGAIHRFCLSLTEDLKSLPPGDAGRLMHLIENQAKQFLLYNRR